jgi:hypothetical protein
MNADPFTEQIRSALFTTASLRAALRDLKHAIAARRAERAWSDLKYNPNWRDQPRASSGTNMGGQWIGGDRSAASVPANAEEEETPRRPLLEEFLDPPPKSELSYSIARSETSAVLSHATRN